MSFLPSQYLFFFVFWFVRWWSDSEENKWHALAISIIMFNCTLNKLARWKRSEVRRYESISGTFIIWYLVSIYCKLIAWLSHTHSPHPRFLSCKYRRQFRLYIWRVTEQKLDRPVACNCLPPARIHFVSAFCFLSYNTQVYFYWLSIFIP